MAFFHSHLGRRLAGAMFIFAVSAAHAMQPLVTDDTGTQGEGGQQLEWSYTRTSVFGQDARTRENGWAYTLGLAPEVDMFVAASHVHDVSAKGWANPVLGLKWRFFSTEDEQTTVALKPELAWPVGAQREAEELGTGRLSGNLTLVLSQVMPFGAVHVNWGKGLDRFRSTTLQAVTHHQRMSVAPVWAVNDRLMVALDTGFTRTSQAGEVTTTRFQELGWVLAVRSDLDWALGVTHFRKLAEKTHAFTTGFTWRY